MKTDYDVHEAERERVAGESFDDLRKSVDAFFHGSKPRPVTADFRRRMHAALDDLLARLKQGRTCGGDRGFARRRV
jgi:hypothetical protein